MALAAAWKDRNVEHFRQRIGLIEKERCPSVALVSHDAFEDFAISVEANNPMLQHFLPTPIPALPKHNSIKSDGFLRYYVHDPRLSSYAAT
ncbi:MAG: hypothetical protein QM744_01005 [Mesorhizobium sp.]